MEAKQRQEEQLLQQEQQYASLEQEVAEQRKIIKKLRQKYKQAESELQDIQRKENDDREDLLVVIREQEKDLDFLNGICAMMLTDNQMAKLKEKVTFDFETNKWLVPPFVVK